MEQKINITLLRPFKETVSWEQLHQNRPITVHVRPFSRGSSRDQLVKQISLVGSLKKNRQSKGTATTNSLPEAL